MVGKRKVTIQAAKAAADLPDGVEPASTAVQVGDLVFTSGIFGIEPASGRLGETPESQFELAFVRMQDLLSEAGLTEDEVGLVTVHIPGPDFRQFINKPWLGAFPD